MIVAEQIPAFCANLTWSSGRSRRPSCHVHGPRPSRHAQRANSPRTGAVARRACPTCTLGHGRPQVRRNGPSCTPPPCLAASPSPLLVTPEPCVCGHRRWATCTTRHFGRAEHSLAVLCRRVVRNTAGPVCLASSDELCTSAHDADPTMAPARRHRATRSSAPFKLHSAYVYRTRAARHAGTRPRPATREVSADRHRTRIRATPAPPRVRSRRAPPARAATTCRRRRP